MAPADSSVDDVASEPSVPDDALESIRIVLVQTSHPGNIGAAARAMKAMGLSRLCLVNPKQFPSAEATARAAGADEILARATVCASLPEAVAECAAVVGTSVRSRHLAWPCVSPREAARAALDPGAGLTCINAAGSPLVHPNSKATLNPTGEPS